MESDPRIGQRRSLRASQEWTIHRPDAGSDDHRVPVTKRGLKAALLGDPGLLEHEIWRIFETEPEPRSIGRLAAWGT